jgi:hypothetical protein
MGGECGTYRDREEINTGVLCENVKERGHLEDPGVDGSMVVN